MPGIKSCLQSASRIPLPESTPPLESGNKEATLIGWGTAVPGVRSPFKATVIPLVRDSHPLFPYRILAPRRSWDGHTGLLLSEPSASPKAQVPHARQELKIKGTRLSYPRGDTDESAGATNDLNSFRRTWHRLSLDVSMTLGVRDTYAQNGRGHRDMPGRDTATLMTISQGSTHCRVPYFRNLAPNDGMPRGDTSEDACIASARLFHHHFKEHVLSGNWREALLNNVVAVPNNPKPLTSHQRILTDYFP